MKNLYDQIIADVLVAAKKTSQNLRFWNRFTYLALSFANSANLIFIMYLVRRLSKNKYVYDIDIIISSMPKLDGIATTAQVKKIYPNIQIIMLTSTDEEDKIFDAIKAGAKGYLLKEEPTAKIVAAIHDVLSGGTHLTPCIARKALDFLQLTLNNNARNRKKIEELTLREQEILGYLAGGLRYHEIADKLSLSLNTLKRHISNLYKKLEVKNKTQAINKQER